VLVGSEFVENRILVPGRTRGLADSTKGKGRIIPLSKTLAILGVHSLLQSLWAFLRPTTNALWCMIIDSSITSLSLHPHTNN